MNSGNSDMEARGSPGGPEEGAPAAPVASTISVLRLPRSPQRAQRSQSAAFEPRTLRWDDAQNLGQGPLRGPLILPPIQGLHSPDSMARPKMESEGWASSAAAAGGGGLIAARRRMTVLVSDGMRRAAGAADARPSQAPLLRYQREPRPSLATGSLAAMAGMDSPVQDGSEHPSKHHSAADTASQKLSAVGNSSIKSDGLPWDQCQSPFQQRAQHPGAGSIRGNVLPSLAEVPIPSPADKGQPSPKLMYNQSMLRGNAHSAAAATAATAAQAAAAPKRYPAWQLSILKCINHRYFFTALVVSTLYIIFEDDFKRAALPPAADLPLEIVATLITVFFIVDMVLGSVARPGYLLGFFFWVDAIATASLMFEVPAVKTIILRIGSSGDALSLTTRGQFIPEVGQLLFIFGKTARVAKIFRLMQLLRLFSMYRQYEARRSMQRVMREGAQLVRDDTMSMAEMELHNSQTQDTRVGQRLEQLTMRRVVVGILLMILLLPGLDVDYGLWGRYIGVDRGGLSMLHDIAVYGGGNGTAAFAQALQAFYGTVQYRLGTNPTSQLFFLSVANETLIPYPDGEARRYDELWSMQYASGVPQGCDLTGTPPCTAWYTSYAIYDWRWYSQLMAILNIMRSLFLLMLFGLGAYFLNHDTRRLVLKPIERMVQRLQDMAENPLKLSGWDEPSGSGSLCIPGRPASRAAPRSLLLRAMSAEMARPGLFTRFTSAWRSMLKRVTHLCARVFEYFWDGLPDEAAHGGAGPAGAAGGGPGSASDSYETMILEDSMQKIGALLAIGFGDAGAEIIAENIKNRGDLNPLVPGRKALAVFGFCDIRQFTDTTEVLQEDVMEYVNSIAKIVHTCVATHGGAANKNIGDAFLLVWKLPSDFTEDDIRGMSRGSGLSRAQTAPNAWGNGDAVLPSSRFASGPGAVAEGVLPSSSGQELHSHAVLMDSSADPESETTLPGTASGGWTSEAGSRSSSCGNRPVAASSKASTRAGTRAGSIADTGGITEVTGSDSLEGAGDGNGPSPLPASLPRLDSPQLPHLPDHAAEQGRLYPPPSPRPFAMLPQLPSSGDGSLLSHMLPLSSSPFPPIRPVTPLPDIPPVQRKQHQADPVQGAAKCNAGGLAATSSASSSATGSSPVAAESPLAPEAPKNLRQRLTDLSRRIADSVSSAVGAGTMGTGRASGSTSSSVQHSSSGGVAGVVAHGGSSGTGAFGITPLSNKVFPVTSTSPKGKVSGGSVGWADQVGGVRGFDEARAAASLDLEGNTSPSTRGSGAGARRSAEASGTLSKGNSLLPGSLPLPFFGASGNGAEGTTSGRNPDGFRSGAFGSVLPGGGLSQRGGDTAAVRSLRALVNQRTPAVGRVPMSAPEKVEVLRLVADNALASFIVVQAALKRSARLHRFCQRPDLNARIPGFRVSMGFGLHVGWAIEGAIGSEFKIDASYLSPNVNMASRLEAATKQFGVSLLLSGDFVDLLSPWVQQRVRQIDCVTVKGSDRPVKLYTYDITLDHIPEPRLLTDFGETEEADEAAQQDMLWQEYTDEWSENPDLNSTWGITSEFKAAFDEGFQAYAAGDWQHAKIMLEECHDMRRDETGVVVEDAPSRVLLSYMAKFDYAAPSTWMGFRELTEK